MSIADAKGVTYTYDPGKTKLDLRKHKDKWKNKKDFKRYLAVRQRFDEQEIGRSHASPYETDVSGLETRNQSGDINAVGGSMSNRWDRDYQLWSMYKEIVSGRSNLKSPTTFAPVEATLAEFMESRQSVLVQPTQESDEDKIKIIDALIKRWEHTSRIDIVNAQTMKECAIIGTSFRGVFYQRIQRKVDIIQGSEQVTKEIHETMRKGSKKEREKVKKVLRDDKKPLTKEKTIIEYDDIVHVPISSYEIYVDPDARCLRGPSYDATDITWRQYASAEQIKREFSNSTDPYIKKDMVDQIVPAGAAFSRYGGDQPFFTPPGDDSFSPENQVEVLRYWNKATDKFIIIVNDIIVRDGPLPYNHKQLPIVMHRFRTFPHRLYGIGYGVILESTQAERETEQNLRIEQKKLDYNSPLFIQQNEYENVASSLERGIEPGMMIPTDGAPSNAVMWMPSSGYDPEYSMHMQMLDQQAIQISGVNSMTYSMPKPNEPVRNNMMAVESTLKLMKMGFKNWGQGYLEAMKQTVQLMKQYYPESYAEEVVDGELTKVPGRKVRVQGIKVEENPITMPGGEVLTEEDGTEVTEMNITEIGEDNYSDLLVKGEYLDLDGDIDMMIDNDTLVPVTKGLQMQNAERFMGALVPYIQNPQIAESPVGKAALRYFAEVNDLPAEFTETLRDKSDDEEVEYAIEQQDLMEAGEDIPGIPGESQAHMNIHSQAIIRLTNEKLNIQRKLMEMGPLVEQAAAVGDMQVQMAIDDQMNQAQQQMTQIEELLARVGMHLETDSVPKEAANQYAQSMAAPPQPPAGPEMGAEGQPMPGGPEGQPMLPEAAMGMQGGGMPPMM